VIAISSFKPFPKSVAVAKNQTKAKASWDRVFSRIVYCGPASEPALNGEKTDFVCTEEFPSIREMVEVAASSVEWACLINADIRVHYRIRFVELELKRLNASCAISLRWQIPDNRIVDQGLDWFAATPEIWRRILPHVPRWFRVGHCLWDTWMLAAFMYFSHGECYDATASEFIYHPKHFDRDSPFQSKMRKPNDGLIDKLQWPKYRLNVMIDNPQMKGER